MTLGHRPEPLDRPASARPRPPADAPHRAAPRSPRRPDPAARDAIRHRLREQHDAENFVAIRNGLIAIGGLVLIAVLGVAIWQREVAQREAARIAAVERSAKLRAELIADQPLTPELARELLRRIEARAAEWTATPDAPAIRAQADQARGVLAEATAHAAFANDVAFLQKEADAGGKPHDAWRQLHGRLAALQPRAANVPAALRAQFDAVADRVAAQWFDALQAAGTAKGAEPRAALALLTAAADLGEDQLQATKAHGTRQQRWRDAVHKLHAIRDPAEQALFAPAAIAGVAWQDLRPPEADWVTGRAANFTRTADRDGLRLVCAGGERAANGVVVLRRTSWHAAALSFTVKLERGSAVVFGRAFAQIADKNAGGLHLVTAAPTRADAVQLPAGRDVPVELTVVGDRITAVVGEEPPQRIELRVTHDERRGAFAVSVHPDTAIAFRNLRIRRLD